MRRILAALALLVAACAEGVPVLAYDETPDATERDAMSALPSWMLEGCALVGLDCYASSMAEGSRGALVLLVTPPTGGTHTGRELVDSACRKSAWVVEGESLTVAHEIGHLFGLAHVETHGNVMHRSSMYAGEELTDDQADDLERRAERFATFCP